MTFQATLAPLLPVDRLLRGSYLDTRIQIGDMLQRDLAGGDDRVVLIAAAASGFERRAGRQHWQAVVFRALRVVALRSAFGRRLRSAPMGRREPARR